MILLTEQFASLVNHHLLTYVSPVQDLLAVAADTFQIDWIFGVLEHLFPTEFLVLRVLGCLLLWGSALRVTPFTSVT